MPKRTKSSRKRILDTDAYDLAAKEQQIIDLRSITLRKMETLDFLNGTNMPSTFRFRQEQFGKIQTFLNSCLQKEKKGYRFLMVTGSPGAGKTLCINSVLANKECDVIRLNANLVKTIADVQDLICLKLLGDSKARTAPQIIRQLQAAKYKKTCIVYVQQVELLFKAAPNVVSEDFLTLFIKKSVNLVLLGISNTIDTIQKYSNKYSFNVTEIQNVVFSPYKAEHIVAIMRDKLEYIREKMKLDIDFSQKLLKFASQKLQSLRKGDFRICLQFLKQVVRESLQKQEEKEEPHFIIDISLINGVFSRMHISKNELMTKLPYQLMILLIALQNITFSTEALFISMKDLQKQLKWIHNSLQISFSHQSIDDRLKELQQYGMVSLRKKANFETQIILQVSTQEIRTSFEDNQLLRKFFVKKK